jgi:hypothetical protein
MVLRCITLRSCLKAEMHNVITQIHEMHLAPNANVLALLDAYHMCMLLLQHAAVT